MFVYLPSVSTGALCYTYALLCAIWQTLCEYILKEKLALHVYLEPVASSIVIFFFFNENVYSVGQISRPLI